MNKRFNFKGNEEQNDKSLRKLCGKSEKIFCTNSSSSNSLIYDSSEFPSLSESSVKVSNDSCSETKSLRYSDKLKFSFQNCNTDFKLNSSKNNHETSGTCNHFKRDASSTTFKSNNSNVMMVDSKKSYVQSVQNTDNQQSKYFQNQPNYPKQILIDDTKQDVKPDNSKKVSLNSKSLDSSLVQIPACKSRSHKPYSTSNVENQSSKEIKCKLIFNKSKIKNKEEEKTDNQPKKKKKRKSKIKRQATFQTGKINVLTPEVHSKILNQSSALTSITSRGDVTDVNNEEEYPELGKSFMSPSKKDISLKKGTTSVSLSKEQVSDAFPLQHPVTDKEISTQFDKNTPEKKGKGESKVVHLKDPITIALVDMLTTRNPKTKEKDLKEEISINNNTGLLNEKPKKVTCNAPNLLDSSKPTVKRGKERENPRPKKLSPLKKIILQGRKQRKEQLLQMRSNSNQEENNIQIIDEIEANAVENINTSDSETEKNISSETTFNEYNSEQSESIHLYECSEKNCSFFLQSSNDLLFVPDGNESTKNCVDKAFLNLSISDELANKQEKCISSSVPAELSQKGNSLNVLEVNDSLLKTLSNAEKNCDILNKVKAAKIILHTKNFREYCNHLVSKDIDTAVRDLLDDLARFQDRMHQKDPVKARMKRRMIYGIKEVKKYIKLRKLKCIVVATDIENIEAEGGLNDILNDIKSLSADHNIPCVFALSRKALGKVCRKPVPVSCIGVLNSDGSEANFKKILELVAESKIDYIELLNKLTTFMSEEDAANLFKAKKEAPEMLHGIRITILRKILVLVPPKSTEYRDTILETTTELNSVEIALNGE